MTITRPNLAIVYFSATNNTRTMARIIKAEFEALGAAVDMHDITARSDRGESFDVAPYDAVVFGFPIHSLRAPKVVREWLRGLDGQGKQCAMFFTFGGFMVHPAHHSTREILRGQGFTVVSSAEFPGAHTFNLGGWQAFVHRPDHRETDLAGQYVAATYRRFTGQDQGLLGELDRGAFSDQQLDQFENYRFNVLTQLPTRNGAQCSMCGLCETCCPTGAMDAETGCADPEKCIACLRCVASCPEKVLVINDTTPAWTKKLAMGNTSAEQVNGQTGKIYL